MKAYTKLFLFLVSGALLYGQRFSTMPSPLPQVEYLGGLPSLEIEKGIRNVNNLVLSSEPSNFFVTGSAPRGHMIVLSEAEVEQAASDGSRSQPEKLRFFNLRDNIWNESRRSLEKLRPPPPPVKNSAVLPDAYKTSKYNQVKVPAWKLDGKILDTKMPKGYKLFVAPK